MFCLIAPQRPKSSWCSSEIWYNTYRYNKDTHFTLIHSYTHLPCTCNMIWFCALGEWSRIRGMFGCPMWCSDWSSQPQESSASQQSNQRTWTQTLSKHNHTLIIPWVLEEIPEEISVIGCYYSFEELIYAMQINHKSRMTALCCIFEVKGRLEKTQITQVIIWFLNWRFSDCHLEDF